VKKVFIATARHVGEHCKAWALQNTPEGFSLTNDVNESDVIISVMYDKIFSKDTLEGKSAYNFHPGPLPEYKGVGLSSWLIINEEKKAGVTLHEIDNNIDTGNIIEVRNFPIDDGETADSLHAKAEQHMLKMFKEWYTSLLYGKYNSVPQDNNLGKVYKKRDLEKAKDITRFIRAFQFQDKEPAYYYNRNNEKRYVKYE